MIGGFPAVNCTSAWRSCFVVPAILLVAGCGKPSNTTNQDFLHVAPQESTARTVVDSLVPIRTVDLEAADVLQPLHIGAVGSLVAILDGAENRVALLNVDHPQETTWVGHGFGRGPGEVYGVADMHVSHDRILLASQQQLVVYDILDSLLLDVRLDHETRRAQFVSGTSFVIMSPTNFDYLFRVVDDEKHVIRAFQPTQLPDLSPLYYEGQIAVSGTDLYYAGFSQPYIKKYSIETGALEFSVATIDNFESRGNYVVFDPGGGRQAFTPSPTAVYSTAQLVVFGSHMLVFPAMDIDRNRMQMLDIYAAGDGSYQHSYRLSGRPAQVVAEGEFLYILEDRPEQPRRLAIYPNPLVD